MPPARMWQPTRCAEVPAQGHTEMLVCCCCCCNLLLVGMPMRTC